MKQQLYLSHDDCNEVQGLSSLGSVYPMHLPLRESEAEPAVQDSGPHHQTSVYSGILSLVRCCAGPWRFWKVVVVKGWVGLRPSAVLSH
jgi:hypothetical protein